MVHNVKYMYFIKIYNLICFIYFGMVSEPKGNMM
jgi:hypothetical protein